MIIGPVRVCYLAAFEPAQTPSGGLAYKVTPLIPEDDEKTLRAVDLAIKDAIDKAVEKGKFSKTAIPRLKMPLRNGTAEAEAGGRGPEFKGHMFFNASNKDAPGIVGSDNKPLMDTTELYSGCWCYLDINFFGYNTNGNVGIGASFNNIMKYKDGDRLDGRQSAEQAFADIPRENIEDDDDLV